MSRYVSLWVEYRWPTKLLGEMMAGMTRVSRELISSNKQNWAEGVNYADSVLLTTVFYSHNTNSRYTVVIKALFKSLRPQRTLGAPMEWQRIIERKKTRGSEQRLEQFSTRTMFSSKYALYSLLFRK